ncbi:MAG: hypothetical protein IJB86_09185 [Clostridia bacterium]|nr:hypothetical protein [Clostridia bacterium]
MTKTLLSENDVKKALGIKSFRNLSKDKVIEFVSLIPHMDKDIALAIVDKFPAFVDFASIAVKELKDLCNIALEKNEASQNEVMDSYRGILDSLDMILKKDDISQEEREFIVEKMIQVADKVSEKDTENKRFITGIVKTGVAFVGFVLTVGAAILGVNVRSKSIPVLK